MVVAYALSLLCALLGIQVVADAFQTGVYLSHLVIAPVLFVFSLVFAYLGCRTYHG